MLGCEHYIVQAFWWFRKSSAQLVPSSRDLVWRNVLRIVHTVDVVAEQLSNHKVDQSERSSAHFSFLFYGDKNCILRSESVFPDTSESL